MKVPELKIGENVYNAKPVTMKMWREITKIDTLDDDSTMADLLTSRLDILGLVYGIDDDVLDELPVEEVIPSYKKVADYVSKLIFSKLDKLPKNSEAETSQK